MLQHKRLLPQSIHKSNLCFELQIIILSRISTHPISNPAKQIVEDKEKRRFKEKGFRSTAFRSANHLLAKCISYNRDNNFDCKEVSLLPSSLLHLLYPLYLLYQTLPLLQVKQIQVSFSFSFIINLVSYLCVFVFMFPLHIFFSFFIFYPASFLDLKTHSFVLSVFFCISSIFMLFHNSFSLAFMLSVMQVNIST